MRNLNVVETSNVAGGAAPASNNVHVDLNINTNGKNVKVAVDTPPSTVFNLYFN